MKPTKLLVSLLAILMLGTGCQSSDSIQSDVDVDLSVLSATMAYTQAYNIEQNPEDYVGKTIRFGGEYAFYEDSNTQKVRAWAMIADASACCNMGIELVLDDSYIYPDDYPSRGDTITAVGTISLDEELAAIGYTSLVIVDTVIESKVASSASQTSARQYLVQ